MITAWSADGKRVVELDTISPDAVISEGWDIDPVHMHKPWSDKDDEFLVALKGQGLPLKEIASRLGRTVDAVSQRLNGRKDSRLPSTPLEGRGEASTVSSTESLSPNYSSLENSGASKAASPLFRRVGE